MASKRIKYQCECETIDGKFILIAEDTKKALNERIDKNNYKIHRLTSGKKTLIDNCTYKIGEGCLSHFKI